MTEKLAMYFMIPIRDDAGYTERLQYLKSMEEQTVISFPEIGDVKLLKVFPEYRISTKKYYQFTYILEPTEEQYDAIVKGFGDIFRLEVYNEKNDYTRGESWMYE